MKKALIIGISGQDGAYLAKLLLEKGYEVHGTSRDHEVSSFRNLEALGIRHRVKIGSMVTSDFRSVITTLQKTEADEIYNLAGQTSVGMSFDYPVETFDSILIGTMNLLECIRLMDQPVRFYNAGSSEVFGNTAKPANEETPFQPRSPYATAKAAAHYAVANYREAYGLYTCTGILFNHESPFRPTRFVTRKIVSTAVRISAGSNEKLKLGNMDIYRDWGWAPEYVEAMWRMLQQAEPNDYVVATGQQSSLKEFVAETFRLLGLSWVDHVESDPSLFRPSDIQTSCGDAQKAADDLGWRASYTLKDVIRSLVDAEHAEFSETRDGFRNSSATRLKLQTHHLGITNDKLIKRNEGFCPICEQKVTFVAKHEWLRDHYLCSCCGSIPRERAIMHVIQQRYPNWRDLRIHESSPGSRGASVKLREQCKYYVASQYDPGLGFGNTNSTKGYQSQDLENQTFPDDAFDIVVTQDVMEHIFDAEAAFRDIHRTLKPSGAHIFTTPLINKNKPTEQWAKRLPDGTIEYLHPPEYHGNPMSSEGSLVTWHWGFDIVDYIQESHAGSAEIIFTDNPSLGIEAEYLEVVIQKKLDL